MVGMSNNNEISKHLDPAINHSEGSGEPPVTVENNNGKTPATDNPEGSRKPDQETVPEGNATPSNDRVEEPTDAGKPRAEDGEAVIPDHATEPAPEEEKTTITDEEVPPEPEDQQEAESGDVAPETAPQQDQPEPTQKSGEKKSKPLDGVVFDELSKKELVKHIEVLAKEEDPILSEKVSRKLKQRYDEIHQQERDEALERFVAEGNDADHFAYKFDELDNRFDGAFKLIRDRKYQYKKNLERNKEQNHAEKVSLLEELRKLVDEEETTSSIESVKKIQERWKSIGPVPGQYVKNLWANYHALMDLYYDQRSIYFELKELDRRKNLEAKLELCERAEKLVAQENLKQAINELNELHEEFKHIGPVPKEEQQNVWDRFKSASDKVYARRKKFIKHLKKDLKDNLRKKRELAEEVQQYQEYASKRITDWNKKTQEILDLQKKWEAVGGLPREQAKDVNKKFWGAFKTFFQNKGLFFKELEGERVTNLEKKKELIATAEGLKNNTDWVQTSEKLKDLQKEWRSIGPVPEKYRNSVYKEFKEACDTFFNNRRAQNQEVEKEYIENLRKKQQICIKIESMTAAGDYDLDKFLDLKQHFNDLGYVPASEVKNIRSQFVKATDDFLDAVPGELEDEARQIRYDIKFEKLKKGPNSNRRIEQREQALRRDISALENDIATWKNNLEFLASSKQADKVKQEFARKIENASEKLSELKSQVRALREL